MSTITHLKHLNKLVTTPDGVDCHLVYVRKVFLGKDIYELSLERLDGGYTMWYAEILNGKFELISCSLYASVETLSIKLAEQEQEQKQS